MLGFWTNLKRGYLLVPCTSLQIQQEHVPATLIIRFTSLFRMRAGWLRATVMCGSLALKSPPSDERHDQDMKFHACPRCYSGLGRMLSERCRPERWGPAHSAFNNAATTGNGSGAAVWPSRLIPAYCWYARARHNREIWIWRGIDKPPSLPVLDTNSTPTL